MEIIPSYPANSKLQLFQLVSFSDSFTQSETITKRYQLKFISLFQSDISLIPVPGLFPENWSI